MSVFAPSVGLPGVSTERITQHRFISVDGIKSFLPGGAIIDGSKTRDANNDNPRSVRAGMWMGRVTSGGKWTNSLLGITSGALANAGTAVTIAAAEAVELYRRQGATGTFTLTGPPVASGTVRSRTITYSAINQTTGEVTITSPTVNEVQTLNFTNSPSGTFRIALIDYQGKLQYTQPITYSATIGTLVSNINTALDAITAASAIVASGSVVTAVALTFSGTNYTGVAQPALVRIDADALTAGDVDVTLTTAGLDGRFIAGSIVGPTDGSQIPLSYIPDGNGKYIPSDGTATGSLDIAFNDCPWEARIDGRQLLSWPSDTSLQQWIRDSLKSKGSQFSFYEQLAT